MINYGIPGAQVEKISLDNRFLDDIGLAALPVLAKPYMLEMINEELEMRTGERLTEGMSDELLDEFAAFIEGDDERMSSLLDKYFPLDDQANKEIICRNYEEAVKSSPGLLVDDFLEEFLPDFGAQVWLVKNKPDFPEVVVATLEEIRQEIEEDPLAAMRRYLPSNPDSLFNASRVYTNLCDLLDEHGWSYQKHEEEGSISLKVASSSFFVEMGIVVDPELEQVYFGVRLPFKTRAEDDERMEAAIKAVNSYLVFGAFEYEADNDTIYFSLFQDFADNQLNKSVLGGMLATVIFKVGHYGERLFAFDREYLSLHDLLNGCTDEKELIAAAGDEACDSKW